MKGEKRNAELWKTVLKLMYNSEVSESTNTFNYKNKKERIA